jgi:hypothetical protein
MEKYGKWGSSSTWRVPTPYYNIVPILTNFRRYFCYQLYINQNKYDTVLLFSKELVEKCIWAMNGDFNVF